MSIRMEFHEFSTFVLLHFERTQYRQFCATLFLLLSWTLSGFFTPSNRTCGLRKHRGKLLTFCDGLFQHPVPFSSHFWQISFVEHLIGTLRAISRLYVRHLLVSIDMYFFILWLHLMFHWIVTDHFQAPPITECSLKSASNGLQMHIYLKYSSFPPPTHYWLSILTQIQF